MSLFQEKATTFNVYLPVDNNSDKVTQLGPSQRFPDFTLLVNLIRPTSKDVYVFGQALGDYIANVPTGGNYDKLATNVVLEDATTLKRYQIINIIKPFKLFPKYKLNIKSS